MIYLDAAATIPTSEDVQNRLAATMRETWGSVSGSHQISRKAKNLLEECRETYAQLLGVESDNIVFTSGSTEALNLVIQGYIRLHRDARIIYSAIEHAGVSKAAEYVSTFGQDVVSLGVDSSGIILESGLDMIQRGDLVCVMPVNNETGVVNDIASIADVVHTQGAYLLLDAVQSLYVCDPKELCALADFVVFSSHKIGGPSGVGMVMIKDRKMIDPLSFGGPQEWELRPGTTPVYLIDAFTYAFEKMVNKKSETVAHLESCQKLCREELDKKILGASIHSRDVITSPHIVALSIDGIEAQMLVTMLDARGVCASRGSACASGATTPSSILLAMGIPEQEALSTIRLSFSEYTTHEEIVEAIDIMSECVNQLRAQQSVNV